MSRAAVQDNSTSVSLFPFLAVLLCTMGSLLVVLIAVTRLSRDTAIENVVQKRAASVSQQSATDDREKVEAVRQYLARLEKTQADAQEQLRKDQQRLSDLEDHMRRLQERAASLGAAATELDALQQEHHDDRSQAARSLARLNKLIEETRTSIEELKKESASQPKSYAVVPYEGPSGTQRPPIYIECRAGRVILQPEGIELTAADFRPPLGPGNPLAAALRAIRAYTAQQNPDAGIGSTQDPYPLILVRPDGIGAYAAVRAAIESWDSDFGYELIDADWELSFPPPDPQRSAVVSQAIELARLRRRVLAEAAPRAYGPDGAGAGTYASDGDEFGEEDEELVAGGYGQPAGFDSIGEAVIVGAAPGGGMTSGSLASNADPSTAQPGTSELAGGPGGEATGATASSAGGAELCPGTPTSGLADGGANGGSTNPGEPVAASPAVSGEQVPVSTAAKGPALGPAGGAAGGDVAITGVPTSEVAMNGAPGGSPGGTCPTPSATPGSQSAMSGAPGGSPGDMSATPTEGGLRSSSSTVGCDPDGTGTVSVSSGNLAKRDDDSKRGRPQKTAVPPAKAGSIPIRRSIHLVVRADRVAIMPERSTASERPTAGKEILLSGRTEEAVGEIVSAINDHIGQWGIAGQGMFWRPVLVLTVGPDAQQRAVELAQLLKHRGIHLRYATTAQRDTESDSHATR